jgi:hypothetical protein
MKDDDPFQGLHEALIEELLGRVKSGEATPSDLNVARQMLKDNGIISAPNNKPIIRLADRIPAFDEDTVPSRPAKKA